MIKKITSAKNVLRKISALFLLFVVCSLEVSGQLHYKSSASSKIFQFINGRWFNGKDFMVQNFYTVNGVFTKNKPEKVDSVIDLTGKYIVPPFGEAHNHNVEWYGEQRFSKLRDKYLMDGIYYVKNPNNVPRFEMPLKDKINIPESIDVSFANGSFTGSGGHPTEIAKRNIGRKLWTEADGEGGFYYVVDDESDFYGKWEALKKTGPDFIKTFLLYSEEYEKRKNDTSYFGWKGLNPALLPVIVKKAHENGLRVSTHIETATDFHNAAIAGVDEINHLAGFRADSTYDLSKYFISEADARLAKSKGIYVVTTLEGSYNHARPFAKTQESINKSNLSMLKKCHVLMAIGSDSYQKTSLPEALYISRLGVFNNLELLKIWCENTPMDIFPKRKIGFLKEGYEASFLVLDANPLEDFKNVQKVQLRVKQGEIIMIK